ncbi:hypothetical protein [Paenarthrobacter ureafaciens]|uniref:hypothetical protein n=1 Tax=Paenarthrobacter ureafaciens TaxID=37931 RepID=UPI001FB340F8|nr:hypothetical protein [Paenarthrobacter ureafaciens]UOD83369.1 hypothetical protein MQZ73_20465 [Paenarthrobacter ureafaciens]WNZ04301.1 hypothetical protein PVT25_01710 [Paenarthrobacter ureafaciens]
MGLRSLFTRHRTTPPAAPSPAPAVIEPGQQLPLTAEQRTDLDVAQAEFLKTLREAGVKHLHACSRNGKPWQDDPQALRTISAILRDVHLEDKHTQ